MYSPLSDQKYPSKLITHYAATIDTYPVTGLHAVDSLLAEDTAVAIVQMHINAVKILDLRIISFDCVADDGTGDGTDDGGRVVAASPANLMTGNAANYAAGNRAAASGFAAAFDLFNALDTAMAGAPSDVRVFLHTDDALTGRTACAQQKSEA